jgi:hypothetical protein
MPFPFGATGIAYFTKPTAAHLLRGADSRRLLVAVALVGLVVCLVTDEIA